MVGMERAPQVKERQGKLEAMVRVELQALSLAGFYVTGTVSLAQDSQRLKSTTWGEMISDSDMAVNT